MAFTAYYLAPGGELTQNLTEEHIRNNLQSGEGLIWVDVSETTNEDG